MAAALLLFYAPVTPVVPVCSCILAEGRRGLAEEEGCCARQQLSRPYRFPLFVLLVGAYQRALSLHDRTALFSLFFYVYIKGALQLLSNRHM